MINKITIGWIYPDLMSTYGDRGNIVVLQKRLELRKVKAEVKRLDLGFNISDLKACDILFMGGAQDKQQAIVAKDFTKDKIEAFKEMVENGIPGLYVCGAYQFLGKYYKEADGTHIPGLGILDLYTENPGEHVERLIGNIIISVKGQALSVKEEKSSPFSLSPSPYLVGFENHGGRTYLGDKVKPFGKVIKGFGNNAKDSTEGALYKNSFGTYLHGPILPKNPHFADYLLKLTLEKAFKTEVNLPDLDDTLEWEAHNAIVKRLGI